jgi:hypothetical protein
MTEQTHFVMTEITEFGYAKILILVIRTTVSNRLSGGATA